METESHITDVQIKNIVFELDEACADLRITEDERRFAHAAIITAWKNKLTAKK